MWAVASKIIMCVNWLCLCAFAHWCLPGRTFDWSVCVFNDVSLVKMSHQRLACSMLYSAVITAASEFYCFLNILFSLRNHTRHHFRPNTLACVRKMVISCTIFFALLHILTDHFIRSTNTLVHLCNYPVNQSHSSSDMHIKHEKGLKVWYQGRWVWCGC